MRRKQVKRPVVQLTSLLDLLFVMIFVSLLQTKAPKAQEKPDPKPTPVAKVEPKPTPTKKEEPKPVEKPRMASITAVFHFYGVAGSMPNFPSGKYRMSGVFDRKNSTIQLGGVGWLEKPAGYDISMVPLSGAIDSNGNFTGRIEDPDCQSFTLRKVSSGAGDVGGVYKGSYVCAQGETGLSLTIQ